MPKTPNPSDVYAGSKVRLQRQMLRMSQTDLGKALGITFQQIQKYEKGTNRISASKLQMISGFLDVPITFFFKADADEPSETEGSGLPVDDMARFLGTSDGMKLNRAFIAITDEKVRRAVVALVKALADSGETADNVGDVADGHATSHRR